MSHDLLTQRQRWFRVFPEGTVEFLLVTRVLALLLLFALLIVRDVQRPPALIALVAVLWVDYVLMIWWAVQMAFDLQLLSAGEDPQAVQPRRMTAILACAPSVAMAVCLAPWPTMLRYYRPGAGQAGMGPALIQGVFLVAFLLLAVPAYRALRKISLGSPLWTALVFVPGLHWFAMHRLARGLAGRLQALEPGDREGGGGGTLALAMADAAWVLCFLPWVITVLLVVVRGNWPTNPPMALVPFCGAVLAVLFAVADLAALEGIQKRFTVVLRKR